MTMHQYSNPFLINISLKQGIECGREVAVMKNLVAVKGPEVAVVLG